MSVLTAISPDAAPDRPAVIPLMPPADHVRHILAKLVASVAGNRDSLHVESSREVQEE